jgi:CDP-4-dehydro-6-deoxyglucose reductase, E1
MVSGVSDIVNERAQQLREQILNLISEYHAEAFAQKTFIPDQTQVPVSGRVFDAADMQSLVDSALDFWLTAGRFAERFEAEFAEFCGVHQALLVNSGSSANLVALSCLTSPNLGERRLKPGDEVITVAAGFPTTVNPIVQNGLVPVFVDIQVPTYNVDPDLLEQALSDKTRAVMLAHTLGNPFDVRAVADFVHRHDLWLIEDCCDALGTELEGKRVGSFGDLATFSFYPAHHITMGEGGCVVTDRAELSTLVESFRNWGRDCWCDPGKANTCGKRFDRQLGGLPHGYDHKYIFSHIGYNLKATDMQAAVGLTQLHKLPGFVEARHRNFHTLYDGLRDLEEFFVLPQATPLATPSWFGFPIAVRPEALFSRNNVIHYLEERKIATRLLFGGNLTRQPAYRDVAFRIAGELKNTDFVMERLFWVGIYPGITPAMMDYLLETFHHLPEELNRSVTSEG